MQSLDEGEGMVSTGADKGFGRGMVVSRSHNQFGHGSGRGQACQNSSVAGEQAKVYHLTR